MTNGSGRYLGVDGYDWGEWAANVPSLALYENKALIAEVRFRRDAGQLCIFADVLDNVALNGTASSAGLTLGASPGLELMLAPPTVDGKKPLAGVTRVFVALHGTAQDPHATVLACRPDAAPLTMTPHFRAVNNRGDFEGLIPKSEPLDFGKELTPVPGASAAARRRFDERGYRLEVEIPLALFPELTKVMPVQIKRPNGVNKSEPRLDFAGPLHFNVALWRSEDGVPVRLPWMIDGLGTVAKAGNPEAWGMANAQIAIEWQPVQGATSYNLYRAQSQNPADANLVREKVAETQSADLPDWARFTTG